MKKKKEKEGERREIDRKKQVLCDRENLRFLDCDKNKIKELSLLMTIDCLYYCLSRSLTDLRDIRGQVYDACV